MGAGLGDLKSMPRSPFRSPLKYALIVVCVASVGCVIPLPHATTESPRWKGRVVDASTSRPLKNARVAIALYPETAVYSRTDGRFEVGPAKHLRWGYLLTPVLIHDLPSGIYEFSRAVSISHPDCFETTISRMGPREIELGDVPLQSKRRSPFR